MLTLLPPRLRIGSVRSHAPIPRWRGPGKDRCFWWTDDRPIVTFDLERPLAYYQRGPRLKPADEVELWLVMRGPAMLQLWSEVRKVSGGVPLSVRVVQVGGRYLTKYGQHTDKIEVMALILSSALRVDLPTAHIWANRGWIVGMPLKPAVFVGICWNGIHTGYDGCEYCERIGIARRRRDRLRWRR